PAAHDNRRSPWRASTAPAATDKRSGGRWAMRTSSCSWLPPALRCHRNTTFHVPSWLRRQSATYAAAVSGWARPPGCLGSVGPHVTATAAVAAMPTMRPATAADPGVHAFVAATVQAWEAGRDVPPHCFRHPRPRRHARLLHRGHGLRAREGRGGPNAEGWLGQALLLRHGRRRAHGVLGPARRHDP